MNVIIVDDERAGGQYLFTLCQTIPDLSVEGVFTNPLEAMDYLRFHPVDLAFLDIEMPELSGLDIARIICKEHLPTCVVFVTGYEQYALEAFSVDAISYLLKPCERSEIEHAVKKAMRFSSKNAPRIFVQTFDHFDIFVQGIPVHFTNAKAKELLAILVDRKGADVRMGFLIDILWPEHPYDDNVKQLYRKAISYLNHALEEYGIKEIFSSARGSCHVNPSTFQCDYYHLLSHPSVGQTHFNGKYMYEYSWAEETLAFLLRNYSS